MSATQALPVALYARISDDQAGDAKGVERQLEDGRKLAAKLGRDVVEFVDNDLSAFKRGVKRPSFEAMVEGLELGELGGIVAYDLDRLWRRAEDLLRVIKVYEERKGLVFATLSSSLDLSTSDGQFMAQVLAAGATKSSQDTARRVARRHRQRQEEGKPGGGPRPFGYRADRMTIDPVEGPALRDAILRVTAGESRYAIINEWNAAGITTTKGNRWSVPALDQLLLSPRAAGITEAVRGNAETRSRTSDGQLIFGAWEKLCSVAELDAMRASMAERANKNKLGMRSPRRYTWTGILRCAECGTGMNGVSMGKRYPGAFRYICPQPTARAHACGKVSRTAAQVEPYLDRVVELHLEALERAQGSAVEAENPWGGESELEGLAEALEEATAAWKARQLPAQAYFALRAELDNERARLEKDRAEHAQANAKRAGLGAGLAQRWRDGDSLQRGAIAKSVVQAVIMSRAPRGAAPESFLEIVWQE